MFLVLIPYCVASGKAKAA